MNNARKIAVEILEKVFVQSSYSNIALNSALENGKLNDKDKGLTTEIVYGTIKYKRTIDYIIQQFTKDKYDKIEPLILNILRISIYQIKYLDKIPEFASVNESVELARNFKSEGAAKFVNGVLRSYLRNRDVDIIKGKNIVDNLSLKYSFEKWMVKLFIKQYGEEQGEKILAALNTTPSVTVRVNTINSDYDKVYSLLTNNGYDIEDGTICPEAIRIKKGKSIDKNPAFSRGLITVQDESAMLVAPSMDLTPGLTVADMCSAPGGKTTHMAEIMKDIGKIYAFDIHDKKLSLIKQNAERLGIKSIRYNALDATKFNDKLFQAFDRVLIDVPCSGLGIIKKKPEIKWNKTEKDIEDIVELQRQILLNCSKYVKIGGILLYSTCTLNKAENDDNIMWFINENPEFKIEPIYFGKVENLIYDEKGFVTILPNECMDGFFMARFRKTM